MSISIIIPTFNEEQNIVPLIQHLKQDPSFPLVKEIIVVDGLSEDATLSQADKAGATVIQCHQRNRAVQMNLGATHASGTIYYFLHADTRPPLNFAQSIWNAHRQEFASGCFRLRFDWSHWFLNFNSWFTRFDFNMFRFGDQSLFVSQQVFHLNNGFQDYMKVFEDQDIIYRISRTAKFKVLPGHVVTSARKYRQNGPFRLQIAYFVVYLCYMVGISQEKLLDIYLFMIPFPRI